VFRKREDTKCRIGIQIERKKKETCREKNNTKRLHTHTHTHDDNNNNNNMCIRILYYYCVQYNTIYNIGPIYFIIIVVSVVS